MSKIINLGKKKKIIPLKNTLNELNQKYENENVINLLNWAIHTFKNEIILASSLGIEDQMLTDILSKLNPKIAVFFLDTGRIHQETYNLLEESMERYNINFKIFFPNTKKIQDFEQDFGPNPFYKSIKLRKKCCWIRKIEPLKRALKGYKAWITGLRREQSITRKHIKKIEWDENNNIFKINPLADWTIDQVWEYIKNNNVPYNRLYDQGFTSIGCLPCTRPIKFGEDIRAGRWWWEDPEKRECGLHIKSEGEVK
ncbi:MAG: phosphoadenylyl-sulfate reductase [Promethearchaeota archaeon]